MSVSAATSTYYPSAIVRDPLAPALDLLGDLAGYGFLVTNKASSRVARHEDHDIFSRIEHLLQLKNRVSELPERCAALGVYEELPGELAMKNARRVLDALVAFEARPDRVVGSAEGGVSVVFFRDDRRASIECLNTGEITASLVVAGVPPVACDFGGDYIYVAVDWVCANLQPNR